MLAVCTLSLGAAQQGGLTRCAHREPSEMRLGVQSQRLASYKAAVVRARMQTELQRQWPGALGALGHLESQLALWNGHYRIAIRTRRPRFMQAGLSLPQMSADCGSPARGPRACALPCLGGPHFVSLLFSL